MWWLHFYGHVIVAGAFACLLLFHIDYLNTKPLSSYSDGLGCFHSSDPEEMGKRLLIYGMQFDTESIVGLPGALFV